MPSSSSSGLAHLTSEAWAAGKVAAPSQPEARAAGKAAAIFRCEAWASGKVAAPSRSEAWATCKMAEPSRREAWAADKTAAPSQPEAPAATPPRHPPLGTAPALEGAPSRRCLPAASLSARIAACTARSCAAGRPATLRSSSRNRRSTSVRRLPRAKQSAENFSARHTEEPAGASARSLPITSHARPFSCAPGFTEVVPASSAQSPCAPCPSTATARLSSASVIACSPFLPAAQPCPR